MPTLLAPFPPPRTFHELDERFGSFTYNELSGGNVTPDPTWTHDNLVVIKRVAGTFLSIQLHRLLAPLFEHCLQEAMRRCPTYPVRMLGGYSPRHQRHDPRLPLSIHSWGVAFDVNWDKNPMGPSLVTDLPKDFIAAFTEQGWEWGGGWHTIKDAMHFQYATGI